MNDEDEPFKGPPDNGIYWERDGWYYRLSWDDAPIGPFSSYLEALHDLKYGWMT